MKTKIKNKQEKGITLIALVVTIVVLLILAGVSISLVLNNNGVISKAKDAKNQYAEAQTNDEKQLNEVSDWIDAKVGDTTGGSGTATEKPETTTPDTSVSFSTAYGRIDVVWLDKNNNVISSPLEPVMMSGMTKVAWNGTTEITPSTNAEWYSYTAQTGTTDGKTSKWANAKNDGSYFVWIPRYAYRITYYSSQSSTDATGYYDGFGMWSASDKKVKYALDTGAKTVVSNGKSYIVHPAFETDINLGGWDSQLSGIWVAKYEMSMEETADSGKTWTNSESTSSTGNKEISATVRAVSKPSQYAWNWININNCFNNSINYSTQQNTGSNSHLMKNSEWGAVAYLTQSKYGRNNHEISINSYNKDSTNYAKLTGVGGSSADNKYNTTNGMNASTTGNLYGIYDLSGGNWEYTSVLYSKYTNGNGTALYTNTANGKYARDEENSQIPANSSKYVTIYPIDTTIEGDDGSMDMHYSKWSEIYGDAIYETSSQCGSNTSWYGEYTDKSSSGAGGLFCIRGGDCWCSTEAGAFAFGDGGGGVSTDIAYRVVLICK